MKGSKKESLAVSRLYLSCQIRGAALSVHGHLRHWHRVWKTPRYWIVWPVHCQIILPMSFQSRCPGELCQGVSLWREPRPEIRLQGRESLIYRLLLSVRKQRAIVILFSIYFVCWGCTFGQFVGVSSPFLPCRFWGLASGHQLAANGLTYGAVLGAWDFLSWWWMHLRDSDSERL